MHPVRRLGAGCRREDKRGAQAGSRSVLTTHELVLRDGSRMYGTIEREDDVEVVFRTQAGALVTVRRADIASLEKITGGILNGEFLPASSNATRLFFAPTGRSLKKGQKSLGVYEMIAPFFQYGVTDRFSIGGGTPLMFGIDESERPFWITPKLQVFETPSTQVAVGVLHGFSMNSNGGGIGYVVGTRGSVLGSVTIGGGLAYGSTRGKVRHRHGGRGADRAPQPQADNRELRLEGRKRHGLWGRASLRRAALR